MKIAYFLIFVVFAIIFMGCAPKCNSPALSTIQTRVKPNDWVWIPAGEFLSGQYEYEVNVDYDYEIMVTTVTKEQYARFLTEASQNGSIGFEGVNPVGYYPGDVFHGYEHEEEVPEGMYLLITIYDPGIRVSYNGMEYVPKPGYEIHPVILVTWFGARAYCEYYGWRLPSEMEWEKAARGIDNRPFPWGEKILPTNANYYSSQNIFEKFIGNSNTTPVGFYNGQIYGNYETLDSPSPYGLYDMAGNVWQWTGDVYKDQHYRYMRGGSKENYAYNLRVWTRNSASPNYFSPNVGFRCVREP
jgi:formylglycine-generating enzyme required for sulfatase activity